MINHALPTIVGISELLRPITSNNQPLVSILIIVNEWLIMVDTG